MWTSKYVNYTDIENFSWEIQFARTGLHCMGLWSKKKSSKVKYGVWSLIITLVLVLPSFVGLFFVKNQRQVLSHIVGGTIFGYIVLSMFIMFCNMELFESIVGEIRENWINQVSKRNQRIMQRHARRTRFVALMEMGMVICNTINFASGPLVAALWSDTGKAEKNINDMWYPFSTSNAYIYGLAYVTQFFAFFVACIAFYAIDSCLFLCVFHVCGQLTILGGEIEMFDDKINHSSEAEKTNRNLCNCLKCITDQHVRICQFIGKIDHYFHIILLVRLIVSTIQLCCVGFDILQAARGRQFAQILTNVLYLIVMTMSLFLHCWLGEQCLQKGTFLADAAYGTRWTEKNPKLSRAVILIIQQSATPLKITAGKVFVLCLRLYKEYIFAAASYLSVLLAVKLGNDATSSSTI